MNLRNPVACPQFTEALLHQNDPFDRSAPVRFVVDQLIPSPAYMRSIRALQVPQDALAIWFLGQNGFLLKDATGLLIAIDLYLTNSCATKFAHLPFRLDRQLPVFIEPEDLDVDIFIATHSHDDHADPGTISRMPRGNTKFLGPFDAAKVFARCDVPSYDTHLIHPGETVSLSTSITAQATFAFPTDNTDLNHTGTLIKFGNDLSFYNTGDTAYAEGLAALLPQSIDVCTICINGGFHNLDPVQAASIVTAIQPRVVIPCHYDMMINNVGSPEMFRVALHLAGSTAQYQRLNYYEPYLYRRPKADPFASTI